MRDRECGVCWLLDFRTAVYLIVCDKKKLNKFITAKLSKRTERE